MASLEAFISYSHVDRVAAEAACAALEADDVRCWMAPRDIGPGREWGAAIVEAIDNAQVVVLIFSSHANESPQILREIERAVARGIPILPMRIADCVPTQSLSYFLNAVHWLDAITPPLGKHLQRLTKGVHDLLPRHPRARSGLPGEHAKAPVRNVSIARKFNLPGRATVARSAIVILVAGAGLASFLRANQKTDSGAGASNTRPLIEGLSRPGEADAQPDLSKIVCTQADPCIITDINRPLRVLPRPQSKIFADPSAKTVIDADVLAFRPLLVFDRVDVSFKDPQNPTGWYKVGTNRFTVKGWMQAKDVVEWKQGLIATYSRPGLEIRRKPALMFEDRKATENALFDHAHAAGLYEQLERGQQPEGVIAREPDRFIDVKDDFYLIPILNYAPSNNGSSAKGRIAKIAAAVPHLGKEPCGTDSAARLSCMAGSGVETTTIDVVFVIDMTGSMQPFVDAVADVIRESEQKFALAGADDRIRFGLVGYRDDTTVTPANEFTTKNFTPGFVGRRDLELILRNVDAKEGGDIPEAVFAGVQEGLRSRWSQKSARIIILIGDAPSHEPPHATSPYSAADLRRLADDQGVTIASIFIRNPYNRDETALGIEQFKTLATNQNGEIAFAPVDNHPEPVKAKLFEWLDLLLDRLRTPTSTQGDASRIAGASGALAGGLVVYLGPGSELLRDIEPWISDRDLTNPELSAFDVNVLVSPPELAALTAQLQALLQVHRTVEDTGRGWLQTVRKLPNLEGVDQLQPWHAIGQSPLMPKWMKGLPYKSELFSLTFEQLESLGDSDRRALFKRLEGFVRTYKLFQASNNWVSLQPGDEPANPLLPLPLSSLP